MDKIELAVAVMLTLALALAAVADADREKVAAKEAEVVSMMTVPKPTRATVGSIIMDSVAPSIAMRERVAAVS